MYMVMFVLDDPKKLDDLLDRWHDQGIAGATVVRSTGLFRRRARTLNLPELHDLPRVVESLDEDHYTIFVILSDWEMVERCLASVEATVGDLDAPHSGVFAAWPLSSVRGMTLSGSSKQKTQR